MILRIVITSCVALLAACAAHAPAPTARSPEPSASTQVAKAKPTPEPSAQTQPRPKAEAESAPKVEAKLEPKLEPKPKTAPTPPAAATKSAPPQPKPQAKRPSTAPAPAATKPSAPAPLDLTSLEARLKQTDAIGLLTKLSLKNQVDDLVGEFRAYHKGERPPTLSQLRPAFDLLLMKVLSLLQDRDPALAHDVSASRDAIWAVLTDPHKLAEFS